MTATKLEVSTLSGAQDLLPALSYAQLIDSLGPLTSLGAFEEGSLAGALAVARLIDRGRILRSGLKAGDLQKALDRYRQGEAWRPVAAIGRALEQAAAIAAEVVLENEAEAAANAPR